MNKNVFTLLLLSISLFNCQKNANENVGHSEKIDSLISVNAELSNQIIQLQSNQTPDKENKNPKIYSLTGRFMEASLNDCFHLSFQDNTGKIWNFDNPDNIYGMNILDTKGELKLIKEISSKQFKIWYANLKGVDCQSSESYSEQDKTYADMPTIIKVEEIKSVANPK